MATSSTADMAKTNRIQTTDPKTWPLGRYFWATVLYALKNDKKAPTLDFYFDGIRSFSLRIDQEQTQFFLCSHSESDAFYDAETGELINIETASDDQLPSSRWENLGFDLIIDDDEEEDDIETKDEKKKSSVFACELDGKQDGIANVAAAIDIVCKIYDEVRKKNSVFDAVVTRWNGKEYESDRRYSDVNEDKELTMHAKGTPHDSTVIFSQCGRNVLLLLRTMVRVRQAQLEKK